MSNELSRRCFLGGAMVSVAATGAANANDEKTLPTRVLGRTGQRVSILALGCGNRLWMAYGQEERGVEALRLALDSGITYLDTAQGYGNGVSESWVGKAAKDRRKELFFATKTVARAADDVMRRCEESLKRLETDHLDLLHLHSLRFDDDLSQIEAKGGALEALYRLRHEKVVRFIGVTSHTDPATLAKALERHDFDCTQMALNAGQQGRADDGIGFRKTDPKDVFSKALPPIPDPNSFEKVALPVAMRKNLGIIAMKVTGQEGLIGDGPGKADTARLLRYALSLPVAVATIGMPQLDHIRQNTDLARSFQPMPPAEMEEFSRRLAGANKLALDRRFREHVDA